MREMPAPTDGTRRDNARFAKMLEALNDKTNRTLRHRVAERAKRLPRCRLNWPPVPSLIVTGRQASMNSRKAGTCNGTHEPAAETVRLINTDINRDARKHGFLRTET